MIRASRNDVQHEQISSDVYEFESIVRSRRVASASIQDALKIPSSRASTHAIDDSQFSSGVFYDIESA